VAAGEPGYVSASVDQVRASGVLVLQAYGQIEGLLKIGGVPAVGAEFLFTLGNMGVSTDFENYKTKTDQDGKFRFENVPAGEGQIVRLIKNGPRSWLHSHNTTVNVEPGTTTFVTLGDTGAVIRGRARLQAPPTEGEEVIVSGHLSASMPALPPFNSAAEQQAFLSSPEWRAQMRQKNFGAVVNADGSFVFDSIPSGTYTLRLTANKPGKLGPGPFPGQQVGSATTTVTVPDNPDPQSPIDVGEIVLVSAPGR
jgi:hypothetical protein